MLRYALGALRSSNKHCSNKLANAQYCLAVRPAATTTNIHNRTKNTSINTTNSNSSSQRRAFSSRFEALGHFSDVVLEKAAEIAEAEEVRHPNMSGDFETTKDYFSANFAPNDTTTSLYDVPEGGYMKIDKKTIGEVFPEGLGGEIAQEFIFTRDNAWMVRGTSKLLCRILDEKAGVDTNSLDKTLQTNVTIEGLTDRHELNCAVPSIKSYGTELLTRDVVASITAASQQGEDDKFSVIRGPGSFTETALQVIKSHKPYKSANARWEKEVPNVILLHGTRGCGKSTVLAQVCIQLCNG